MSRESDLTRLWLKWVESELSQVGKFGIWAESELNHSRKVNCWDESELGHLIVTRVRVESARKKSRAQPWCKALHTGGFIPETVAKHKTTPRCHENEPQFYIVDIMNCQTGTYIVHVGRHCGAHSLATVAARSTVPQLYSLLSLYRHRVNAAVLHPSVSDTIDYWAIRCCSSGHWLPMAIG